MQFTAIVNGPMFKMFLEGISTVATTAIITFGPEKITCNHLTPAGDLMESSLLPPFKSNLTSLVSLKIDVDKILEDIGEEVLPDDLAIMWNEEVFDAIPNVEETDDPESLVIFSQKSSETPLNHPEPPRINYPLRFSIDMEVLKRHLANLPKTPRVIISYENGPLYLATESWSDKVEIPGSEFHISHLTRGSYSSLFSRDLLESVIQVLDIFESISIALGEDLPLIIVGIDPNLKIGYMIAQQV